jgi:hypothetical protein
VEPLGPAALHAGRPPRPRLSRITRLLESAALQALSRPDIMGPRKAGAAPPSHQ